VKVVEGGTGMWMNFSGMRTIEIPL